MDIGLDCFTQGMMIGFAIAAPVGPIGVLCIRRTLVNGVVSGLATGTGAALADALYGAVAAFGLAFVSDMLQKFGPVLQLLGGIFLLYMGFKTFLKRPKASDMVSSDEKEPHNLKQIAADFSTTFLLTLTNPATIISFMAIFAGIGVGSASGDSMNEAALTVAGVFLGSLLWWCILAGGVGAFRHKLDRKGMRFINILSGMIIGGFGAAVLGRITVKELMILFN